MVERQQDVVDRRAIGHDGYSARTREDDTLPYHETARVSMGGWRQHRRRRRQILRVSAPWGRARHYIIRRPHHGPVSRGICTPGRLKCRTALYRPAVPERNSSASRAPAVPDGLMGRSQAVRQRILIPPFGGSIPPAPASQSLDLRLRSILREIPCNLRGFRAYSARLQVSKNRQLWRESPESLQPTPQKFPFLGRLLAEINFEPTER